VRKGVPLCRVQAGRSPQFHQQGATTWVRSRCKALTRSGTGVRSRPHGPRRRAATHRVPPAHDVPGDRIRQLPGVCPPGTPHLSHSLDAEPHDRAAGPDRGTSTPLRLVRALPDALSSGLRDGFRAHHQRLSVDRGSPGSCNAIIVSDCMLLSRRLHSAPGNAPRDCLCLCLPTLQLLD
jgi:hypothetical protein